MEGLYFMSDSQVVNRRISLTNTMSKKRVGRSRRRRQAAVTEGRRLGINEFVHEE
jgi:hypothetical protein